MTADDVVTAFTHSTVNLPNTVNSGYRPTRNYL